MCQLERLAQPYFPPSAPLSATSHSPHIGGVAVKSSSPQSDGAGKAGGGTLKRGGGGGCLSVSQQEIGFWGQG